MLLTVNRNVQVLYDTPINGKGEDISTIFGVKCRHPLFDFLNSLKSHKSKTALKKLKKLFTTIRFVHKLRFSENYFVVKGAALILPQSECATRRKSASLGGGGDIQKHLQRMSYLLRPQETIKVAVKLETAYPNRHRYLAVVATTAGQDTDECILLGIDVGEDKTSIGLVIPVWGDTKIRLDGDGGMMIMCEDRERIFKPISVQAMWSALQNLNKMRAIASTNNYHPKGLTHTWVSYYQARVSSAQSCINEWDTMEDVESKRKDPELPSNKEEIEEFIKEKLREIMSQVDLEEVTCKFIRKTLEESVGMSLEKQKVLIDEEMIIIMRQMDAPSQIFDYLYLGSEWNASNLEELQKNGIKYILNITREIDNFFPDIFEYCNIRVFDIPQSDLLRHWDKTYKFIKKAKHHHSKVLVHCKMGISRSASSVIAFAMKEYDWSLERAMDYVHSKRNVINPNKGFRKQLETYEGILDASKQRHNSLWKSVSESDLTNQQLTLMSGDTDDEDYPRSAYDTLNLDFVTPEGDVSSSRPRSWSPTDGPSEILMKASQLAAEADSSDEDLEEDDDLSNYPPYDAHFVPIPMTRQQIEEFELSSRSADSLDIDEAFVEYEPDDQGYSVGRAVSFECGPVVLLRYGGFADSEVAVAMSRKSVASVDSEVSEESDFEDYHGDHRKQSGFYDISMLTGCEPRPRPQEVDPQQEVDEDYIQKILHPDMKLELAVSEFKKKIRIAKLLLYQERESKKDNVKIVKSSSPAKRKTHRKQNSGQFASKLRPDDFWIKENEEKSDSSDDGVKLDGVCETETSTDSPEKQVKQESETVSLSGVEGDDTRNSSNQLQTTNDDSKTFVAVLEMNVPDSKVNSDSSVNVDEAGNKTEESPADSSSATPAVDIKSSPVKEVGIWQHYDKEDIPWCPGTVKKTTREMEGKSSTVTVAKDTETVVKDSAIVAKDPVEGAERVSESSGSMVTTVAKDTMETAVEIVQKMSVSSRSMATVAKDTTETAVERAQKMSVSSGSVDSSPAGSRECVSQELECGDSLVASVTKRFGSPLSSPVKKTRESSDGTDSNGETEAGRTSVYELEDIQLEPDIVSRIKKQIEQRERSSSYSDLEDSDGKVVQRSSSWKHQKKTLRFDRNSVRRRTVLPVVRRHGTRHSSLSIDLSGAYPLAMSPTLTVPMGTRDTRSASPLLDDCPYIRSGSVKKQRQEIETKSEGQSDASQSPASSLAPKVKITQSQGIKAMDSQDLSPGGDKNASPTVKREMCSNKGVSPVSPIRGEVGLQKDVCSPVASIGGNKDLSPAVVEIISKSPTLRRKIDQSEVIACHVPEAAPFPDQWSPLVTTREDQRSGALTPPTVAKTKLANSSSEKAATPSPDNSPGRRKNAKNESTGDVDKTSATGDDSLKWYEEEGIEWNPGTVKQQMEAIESKAQSTVTRQPQSEVSVEVVAEDCSSSGKGDGNFSTASDTLQTSGDVRIRDSTQSVIVKKDKEVSTVTPSDQREGQGRLSIVQKIKRELESNMEGAAPASSPQLTKVKCSLERKHSLGSQTDLNSKRRSIVDATNVGRSSSFKENSPTKFDSDPEFVCSPQKSGLSDKRRQDRSLRAAAAIEGKCETVIATHSPTGGGSTGSVMSQKQVVIIPKGSDDECMYKNVITEANATTKYSTDTSSSATLPRTSPHDPDLAKEDNVKVKQLLHLFESSPEQVSESPGTQTCGTPPPQKSLTTSDDRSNNNVQNSDTTSQEKSTTVWVKPPALQDTRLQNLSPEKGKKLHGKTHPLAKLTTDGASLQK